MSQPTPLRVLFLGKDAGRGGMQKELLSIVQFLDKKRFSPLVLLQEGGDILPLYKQHAPTEVYSQSPQVQNKRKPSPRLQRWLPDGVRDRAFPNDNSSWAQEHARRFDPQIIVRQYMRSSPIFDALENSSIPTLQVFLMNGAQAERLSEETLRWLTPHPIIYPGKGVGRFLDRCMGVELAPEREICTGLDLTVATKQLNQHNRVRRADLDIAEDDLVIGTCGSIVFLKGTDLWVEAAALLRNRYPNRRLKFLWIGGSKTNFESVYGRSILRLIEQLGLKNDVIITGVQEDVYAYDDLCDIYVQSSRDDAYPLATCEAMVLSKPVVSFPQGVALEEYAREGVVLVPAYDPEALADGIAQLIESPEERKRRGLAARQVIEKHLEINGTVRRYEEMLLNAVTSSAPQLAQTS